MLWIHPRTNCVIKIEKRMRFARAHFQGFAIVLMMRCLDASSHHVIDMGKIPGRFSIAKNNHFLIGFDFIVHDFYHIGPLAWPKYIEESKRGEL